MFKQAQPRMALINHYESGGPALDAELVAKSAMVSIRHSRPLMPRQGSVSLVLEAVSDKQKSDFKAEFPKQYCGVGLYRWVRCPNYLGEITFWVGNWVIGIMIYDTPLKWIASLAGMVCIVLIMMGSTKRLERSQGERYGNQLKYQEYIQTVPVLFPFVPVYSLEKVRVFLE